MPTDRIRVVGEKPRGPGDRVRWREHPQGPVQTGVVDEARSMGTWTLFFISRL